MERHNVVDLRKSRPEGPPQTRGIFLVSFMILMFFGFMLLATLSSDHPPDRETAQIASPHKNLSIEAE